ncbi:MAG: RNA recognition motif domain-containing protein [Minisyncoccota bacterium]
MAKKLYVGGLPYSTTEDELREAFSQAGAVESASIIMDRMTGRSKGFGFVEMTSDEDAQKGIDLWNGKDFGGRTLTVNEARWRSAQRTISAVVIVVATLEAVAVETQAAAEGAGNSPIETTRPLGGSFSLGATHSQA